MTTKVSDRVRELEEKIKLLENQVEENGKLNKNTVRALIERLRIAPQYWRSNMSGQTVIPYLGDVIKRGINLSVKQTELVVVDGDYCHAPCIDHSFSAYIPKDYDNTNRFDWLIDQEYTDIKCIDKESDGEYSIALTLKIKVTYVTTKGNNNEQ